ncbi:MAG: PadR family transcriptional regulator [Candidatus Bathyarchaeota archaeon]|nr:PadR family transcriptional regulator [Candidatus Bathyarchaeota archaeon]
MENSKAEINRIKKKFIDRLIKNFLDIIILAHFRDKVFSGYDVMVYVNREFGSLLSSGTVYSHMYALERQRLIELVGGNERKHVYRLTDRGKLTAEVLTAGKEIQEFMKKIADE